MSTARLAAVHLLPKLPNRHLPKENGTNYALNTHVQRFRQLDGVFKIDARVRSHGHLGYELSGFPVCARRLQRLLRTEPRDLDGQRRRLRGLRTAITGLPLLSEIRATGIATLPIGTSCSTYVPAMVIPTGGRLS